MLRAIAAYDADATSFLVFSRMVEEKRATMLKLRTGAGRMEINAGHVRRVPQFSGSISARCWLSAPCAGNASSSIYCSVARWRWSRLLRPFLHLAAAELDSLVDEPSGSAAPATPRRPCAEVHGARDRIDGRVNGGAVGIAVAARSVITERR